MTGAQLLTAYVHYQTTGDMDALLTCVRRYALRCKRDEDLAQEVVLKVWVALQDDPVILSFPGWVRTIVERCCINESLRPQNRSVPVDGGVLEGLLNQSIAAPVRTPALFHDLITNGPPQARELLAKAVAEHAESLYEAGRMLGMTEYQVEYRSRLLRKYLCEKSATA
jgi:DNA-directed RNA polymerase specialized sigma24 family protein